MGWERKRAREREREKGGGKDREECRRRQSREISRRINDNVTGIDGVSNVNNVNNVIIMCCTDGDSLLKRKREMFAGVTRRAWSTVRSPLWCSFIELYCSIFISFRN